MWPISRWLQAKASCKNNRWKCSALRCISVASRNPNIQLRQGNIWASLRCGCDWWTICIDRCSLHRGVYQSIDSDLVFHSISSKTIFFRNFVGVAATVSPFGHRQLRSAQDRCVRTTFSHWIDCYASGIPSEWTVQQRFVHHKSGIGQWKWD